MQPIPAALLTLGLLAAGCAPLPSTDARSVLAPELAARGLEVDDSTLLEELRGGLAGQEITPETAVRIALLNNPGLQAEYAVLGFAAADVYEAARPRNPSLSVSVLSSDESGAADQVASAFHSTSRNCSPSVPGRALPRESTSACVSRSAPAFLKPQRTRRQSSCR